MNSILMPRVWTAVSVYVLIAISKKRLHLDSSLQTLLQILSVTVFGKIPLKQAVTIRQANPTMLEIATQLNLFGF